MGILDEQKLLREHYEIMADIRVLKEYIVDDKATKEELLEKVERLEELLGKVENLEEKAAKNDLEHDGFAKEETVQGLRASFKEEMEKRTIIMSSDQAKADGKGWLALVLKNPTHLMWLLLAVVIVAMVIQGYSYAEISQVLDKMR